MIVVRINWWANKHLPTLPGYLVASVPALRGCHTQAKSLDELMQRIEEAILLCLEVALASRG